MNDKHMKDQGRSSGGPNNERPYRRLKHDLIATLHHVFEKMPMWEKRNKTKDRSEAMIPCSSKWCRISWRTLRLSFSNPSAAESSPICSTVAHEDEDEDEDEGLGGTVSGSRDHLSWYRIGSSGSMDLILRKKRQEPVRMEPRRRDARKESRFLRDPTCLIPVTEWDISVSDRTWVLGFRVLLSDC